MEKMGLHTVAIYIHISIYLVTVSTVVVFHIMNPLLQLTVTWYMKASCTLCFGSVSVRSFLSSMMDSVPCGR